MPSLISGLGLLQGQWVVVVAYHKSSLMAAAPCAMLHVLHVAAGPVHGNARATRRELHALQVWQSGSQRLFIGVPRVAMKTSRHQDNQLEDPSFQDNSPTPPHMSVMVEDGLQVRW